MQVIIITEGAENQSLFEVLDEVSKVRNLAEIICVDDALKEAAPSKNNDKEFNN